MMLLQVEPFKMGSDKDAALKPLEEAAEVFSAFQEIDGCGSPSQCGEQCEVLEVCEARVHFADELADCIQACVNIAARYKIDLSEAMRRCEERNRRRGRYN